MDGVVGARHDRAGWAEQRACFGGQSQPRHRPDISTYGQFGKEDYLGRPGYDALAQAYGGMMNITGDPAGPPQRAKVYTGDYLTALTDGPPR